MQSGSESGYMVLLNHHFHFYLRCHLQLMDSFSIGPVVAAQEVV